MAVKPMKWANKKSKCSNMGRLLEMCKRKEGRAIVGKKSNKNTKTAITRVARALEACKRK
jgi:hypothetical protein